jgi:hypothetical protein
MQLVDLRFHPRGRRNVRTKRPLRASGIDAKVRTVRPQSGVDGGAGRARACLFLRSIGHNRLAYGHFEFRASMSSHAVRGGHASIADPVDDADRGCAGHAPGLCTNLSQLGSDHALGQPSASSFDDEGTEDHRRQLLDEVGRFSGIRAGVSADSRAV